MNSFIFSSHMRFSFPFVWFIRKISMAYLFQYIHRFTFSFQLEKCHLIEFKEKFITMLANSTAHHTMQLEKYLNVDKYQNDIKCEWMWNCWGACTDSLLINSNKVSNEKTFDCNNNSEFHLKIETGIIISSSTHRKFFVYIRNESTLQCIAIIIIFIVLYSMSEIKYRKQFVKVIHTIFKIRFHLNCRTQNSA